MRFNLLAVIAISLLSIACQESASTNLKAEMVTINTSVMTIDKFLKDNHAEEWLIKEFRNSHSEAVKECGGEVKEYPFAFGIMENLEKIIAKWTHDKALPSGTKIRCEVSVDFDFLGKLEDRPVCQCTEIK